MEVKKMAIWTQGLSQRLAGFNERIPVEIAPFRDQGLIQGYIFSK